MPQMPRDFFFWLIGQATGEWLLNRWGSLDFHGCLFQHVKWRFISGRAFHRFSLGYDIFMCGTFG